MKETALDIAAANRRGIVSMMTAVAFFVCGDACMKLAIQGLPVGETIALRSIFTVTILLGLISARKGASILLHSFDRAVMLRSAIEACTIATFVTTLTRLGLGEVTVINQTAPLIVTALVAIFYRQKVGWRRWSATIVGFSGVVLVARPSPSGVDWPILLALGTAFLVALRDLVTRRIPAHVPTDVVAFATALFALPLALALSAGTGEVWRIPDAAQAGLIAGAAFFSFTGNLFLISAFRGGDVTVISPFRYVVVLYALFLGHVLFGETPDALSLAGLVLIVGSGLYTLHRERVRAAEALRNALPKSG